MSGPRSAPAEQWQTPRVPPRIYPGELLSTTAALTLIPLMLVFEWYGRIETHGGMSAGTISVRTGWSALGAVRWVLSAVILITVGATLLHAIQRPRGTRTETDATVLALGTIASLLVGYRVLIMPPDSAAITDLKVGAPLGLLALLAVTIGGWRSLHEARESHTTFTPPSRPARILAPGRTSG